MHNKMASLEGFPRHIPEVAGVVLLNGPRPGTENSLAVDLEPGTDAAQSLLKDGPNNAIRRGPDIAQKIAWKTSINIKISFQLVNLL